MNRTDFIKENVSGKILDLGCENSVLHELIYSDNVYGLDIFVKRHRKNVVKGDAQYLPFKNNTFDSLVAGELIEHLEKPESFLKECQRVLKKNGVIIITTPNKNSLVNKVFKSYNHSEHVHLLGYREVREMVSKYFRIDTMLTTSYDEVSCPGSKHKKFFWLRNFIHRFLSTELQENIIILGKNDNYNSNIK